jgi:hypothetical protein
VSFPGRENVAAALFALVDTTVQSVLPLVTSSRHFRFPTQVDSGETPALFQLQTGEDHARDPGGLIGIPPKRTMRFEMWIYVATSQEDSVVPTTSMNAVVDAMQDAFTPPTSSPQNVQTLGKLVASARIRGDVFYGENFQGDGRNLVIVPIEVIVP